MEASKSCWQTTAISRHAVHFGNDSLGSLANVSTQLNAIHEYVCLAVVWRDISGSIYIRVEDTEGDDRVTIDWQNKSHQKLDCSCRLPHQVITRREYYKRQVFSVYPLSVHDLSNEEDATLFANSLSTFSWEHEYFLTAIRAQFIQVKRAFYLLWIQS